ncbi:protein of unknown function [Paraburkholderia kururiensis]
MTAMSHDLPGISRQRRDYGRRFAGRRNAAGAMPSSRPHDEFSPGRPAAYPAAPTIRDHRTGGLFDINATPLHEGLLWRQPRPNVYAHKPSSKWLIRLLSVTKSLKINFFKVKFSGIEKEVRIGG